MYRTESAFTRARRPILLVDHAGWDRRSVASAAHAAALLPRTLPNPERARVHLSGAERFDLLVIPANLDSADLAALVADARRLRPTLPILILARDLTEAARIEARLWDLALADRLTRVEAATSEYALQTILERSVRERTIEDVWRDPEWENAA